MVNLETILHLIQLSIIQNVLFSKKKAAFAIANYSLLHLADLSTFVLGCLSMIKQVDGGYTTHLEAPVAFRPFRVV